MTPTNGHPKTQGRFNTLLQPLHPGLALDKLGLQLLLLDRKNITVLSPERGSQNKPSREGDRDRVLKAICLGVRESKPRELYNGFYQERLAALRTLDCQFRVGEVRPCSRLVTGLSGAAAMQVSLTLDYTYGVPILPGSSVKGACLAAAEQDQVDKDDRNRIYGPLPGKGGVGSVGSVVFYDALPCNWTGFQLDIMTPHHTKYYAKEKGFDHAPDVENPVPVPFLAVPAGTQFLFAFGHRRPRGKTPEARQADLEQCQADLVTVIEHWQAACEAGFGAKTSAGYGWMEAKDSESVPETVAADPLCREPPAFVPDRLPETHQPSHAGPRNHGSERPRR